jgi:MarR family 2-MHQ and catechol resistance regulon transcriptional repressor
MGTRYEGSKQQVRSLDAYIKLMRAANSVTARTHRHLASSKLTVSQFAVLEALYHLGPMSQRDLGDKILKSSGNMTMVIDNLEKRKLVKRKRDRQDRRVAKVHLIDKGLRLISDIFPNHVEGIMQEMSILTASELEELGRLCRKLGLKKDL